MKLVVVEIFQVELDLNLVVKLFLMKLVLGKVVHAELVLYLVLVFLI